MAAPARNMPHPAAAVAPPAPGERLSDETRKLRIAIAQAIQKKTSKNLDRYNSQWAKGGDNGLYPTTKREAQNFPLVPKTCANYEL
jgi:hypothetical protein